MNGLFSTLQKSRQHFLVLGFLHVFLLIILFLIIRLLFGLLCFLFSLLLLILLLLCSFLNLIQSLPLLCKAVCFSCIIGDNDVVKDGLCLHLPQIESNESKVRVLVHCIIIHKFRIVDLLGLPHTLVLWVVLHWRLPFAILFIIPIIRLLGLSINNTLLRYPVIRFGILGIIHHRGVNPITWLLVLRICDDL